MTPRKQLWAERALFLFLTVFVSVASAYYINGNLDVEGYIQMDEQTDPANPAADHYRLYINDVSGTTKLMGRDSAGTETEFGSGGGSKPDYQQYFSAGDGRTGLLSLGSGWSVNGSSPAVSCQSGLTCGISFDASTDETAYFNTSLMDDYDGGDITIRIVMGNSGGGGSSNETQWDVTLGTQATDQVPAAPSGTADTSTTQSYVASQTFIHTITLTGSELNSVAAGNLIRISFTRDADNVLDTWTADARIDGIEIQYGRT